MNTAQSSMKGKVCMVTGANGSMGKVVATDLARRGGTVVLVCPSRDEGESLRRAIIDATGNHAMHVLTADLSDQSSIRRLVDEFHQGHSALHLLVNNAGAYSRKRRLSVDGVELHLAINHLAPFLLTNLLVDTLKASAPSRVVNVASQAMADSRRVRIGRVPRPVSLDLDDLQSERRFEPMQVYGRAKLALVMCGYALARRLEGTGVTVNALHPGLVATGMVDNAVPWWAKPFLGVIKLFLLSPEEGARTTIYLATAPEVGSTTGKYFRRGKERRSPNISYDASLQEQLWQASSRLVGLTS
jgi:NAD(P)-dependent dehydrogenase (short-subunit alcohol dehydrogenase family)